MHAQAYKQHQKNFTLVVIAVYVVLLLTVQFEYIFFFVFSIYSHTMYGNVHMYKWILSHSLNGLAFKREFSISKQYAMIRRFYHIFGEFRISRYRHWFFLFFSLSLLLLLFVFVFLCDKSELFSDRFDLFLNQISLRFFAPN